MNKIKIPYDDGIVNGFVNEISSVTSDDLNTDVTELLILKMRETGAIQHSSVSVLKRDLTSQGLESALIGKRLIELSIPWIDGEHEEDGNLLSDPRYFLTGFILISPETDSNTDMKMVNEWINIQRETIKNVCESLNALTEDELHDSCIIDDHLSIVNNFRV